MQGATTRVQTPPTPSVGTKPRDIPRIGLEELEGLGATGTLALFFEGTEQCTPIDAERVRVAKSRVSPELALLLQNRQEKGQCASWYDVKMFLGTEFAVDLNLDRAWKE